MGDLYKVSKVSNDRYSCKGPFFSDQILIEQCGPERLLVHREYVVGWASIECYIENISHLSFQDQEKKLEERALEVAAERENNYQLRYKSLK